MPDDGTATVDPILSQRKDLPFGDHLAVFLLHNLTYIAHQGKSKAFVVIRRSSLHLSYL